MKTFLKPLTTQEETFYLRKCRQGDKAARDVLIERNLRLVAHIVKKYQGVDEDLDDLISIGTIGLIKAVSTYDMTKGSRLATYAARCIDNELLMMLRSRKKFSREVSLYEPIGTDKEGNEIHLLDIVEANEQDITDQCIHKERILQLYGCLKIYGGLQMTKTKSMIYCGLFTALIAAGAFIKIPVPVVPFTLQYLFTMLAGLFLGSRRGMISVVAYMLLGLAGLPIFSEGGGIWYIFKPSFGYIIGFCLGTYVTGLIAERLKQKTVFHYLLANLAGLMIVYACGMVYYYVICNYVIDTPIGIWPLILYCFLLAVPGDIALSVLGAVIAKRVRPVVLQYLFDSKSNVRLEREELVK